VNTWALLTNGQARSNSKRKADGLDEQCPKAEEAFHDEACNDAFDLGDTRAGSVRSIRFDKAGGCKGKDGLCIGSEHGKKVERGAELTEKRMYII
jgi:hypothetical protein